MKGKFAMPSEEEKLVKHNGDYLVNSISAVDNGTSVDGSASKVVCDAPWAREGRCICRRGVRFGGFRCTRICHPNEVYCGMCTAAQCACSCGACDPSSSGDGSSDDDNAVKTETLDLIVKLAPMHREMLMDRVARAWKIIV